MFVYHLSPSFKFKSITSVFSVVFPMPSAMPRMSSMFNKDLLTD